MNKVTLYTSLFLLTLVFTACNKEVVKPNSQREIGENCNLRSTTNPNPAMDPASQPDTSDEGITDPNDDDYSSKRPTKVRK